MQKKTSNPPLLAQLILRALWAGLGMLEVSTVPALLELLRPEPVRRRVRLEAARSRTR